MDRQSFAIFVGPRKSPMLPLWHIGSREDSPKLSLESSSATPLEPRYWRSPAVRTRRQRTERSRQIPGVRHVRSSKSKQISRRNEIPRRVIVAGWIGTSVGALGAVTESKAQQLLPTDRQEIADQERLSWSLQKFPAQPYMNEVYWQYSKDTPAFFRDSLLQYVARTYYLTRDNSDGSKSQAWATGGWLAFRSGLIGDSSGCI